MTDKRLRMPTSCAQLILKFDLDGQPCENVLYFVHQHRETTLVGFTDSPMDGDSADYVGGVAKSWLTGTWAGSAHDKAKATEINVVWNTVIDVGPLAGRVYQDSDFPIFGTQTDAALPNNDTIAVEWKTALLGRSYHGRTYHVGLTSNQVDLGTDPNVITTEAAGEFIDNYNALRTAMTAVEFSTLGVPDEVNDRFPLVVMSFRHHNADRDPAVRTIITSAALQDLNIDAMRRRLPGHNRHR